MSSLSITAMLFQGDPLATMTDGGAIIELMNTLGYDIATPGNHEFDYGMERFMELVEMADFPYISCNFNKAGKLIFDPYIIKDIDGTKIAFVGITTPWTLRSSTPKYFMDKDGNYIYGFMQGEGGQKLYAAVQKAVDEARAKGADYVIAMAHLGNVAEDAPYTYADVLVNTTGIDVPLTGTAMTLTRSQWSIKPVRRSYVPPVGQSLKRSATSGSPQKGKSARACISGTMMIMPLRS